PGHAHAASSCPTRASRVVNVATATAFRAALIGAKPGDQIRLADGTYRGHFTLTRKGTKAHPVVVCGSSRAAIDGGGTSTGYALRLADTTWVVVSGVTVRHGQKGVIVDGSTHVSLRNI